MILEGQLQGNLYMVSIHLHIYVKCLKRKTNTFTIWICHRDRKTKRILEIISTDICGPINPLKYCVKTYFIGHFSHFFISFHLSECLSKQFRDYCRSKCINIKYIVIKLSRMELLYDSIAQLWRRHVA